MLHRKQPDPLPNSPSQAPPAPPGHTDNQVGRWPPGHHRSPTRRDQNRKTKINNSTPRWIRAEGDERCDRGSVFAAGSGPDADQRHRGDETVAAASELDHHPDLVQAKTEALAAARHVELEALQPSINRLAKTK